MSNAENWLNHTKSEHFFLKWSSHAESTFLKNCRHARTLDIFKKSQAFLLKHYGRPELFSKYDPGEGAFYPTWYRCLNKTTRMGTIFRGGQCPALSSFRVGKIQLLNKRVGFSGSNGKKAIIVEGSQN